MDREKAPMFYNTRNASLIFSTLAIFCVENLKSANTVADTEFPVKFTKICGTEDSYLFICVNQS